MRDLAITYGSSRNAGTWNSDTIIFSALCDKLRKTCRTSETVEEYKMLPKARRDEIKDIGGFVAGRLKDKRRKKENLLCRSMLAYDLDDTSPEFLADINAKMRHKCCYYTTHSHTEETPRIRLIMPLTRDLSPDEFNAVARHYANDNGLLEMTDRCSFSPNQLMYWPSTPADGQYLFGILEGEWLDPDTVLAAHSDWQDVSTLPTVPGETRQTDRQGSVQQDPLTKGGLIGAFNNVFYPIQNLLDGPLAEFYEPTTMPDRYTHIGSAGTSGAVVYEDKFLYSFHATDPAYGKLLSAFDLMRVQLFKDYDDRESLNLALQYAAGIPEVQAMVASADFSVPIRVPDSNRSDGTAPDILTEPPIPFEEVELPPFPVEALPARARPYVEAVAEATQTPVGMAATAALAVLASCTQGRYVVQAKPDWVEPTNLYALTIAEPSERKSAVNAHMTRAVHEFERKYNAENAGAVEASRMRRRILEKRQKAVEDQIAKGKADEKEIAAVAKELAEFKERTPMQHYSDDVTPEKLVSIMAAHNGVAAIISAEGGIFDQLSGGMYSKTVNIDVFLKGHAGDAIRIDRIGRDSESVEHPALTLLLAAQPSVLAGIMQNGTFRSRGLTARFLYTIPKSYVGARRYRTEPIPPEASRQYRDLIFDLLDEEGNPEVGDPEVITLSSEADAMLEAFANELEPKLRGEYADFADWAGKLCGTVVRIAGILCRADAKRTALFLEDAPAALEISGEIMADAIAMGRYYTEHAKAAYQLMGADPMIRQCKYVLAAIRNTGAVDLTKRDIMRLCRSFKTADELQPVLDRLCERGYLAPKAEQAQNGSGRRGSQTYLVNLALYAA